MLMEQVSTLQKQLASAQSQLLQNNVQNLANLPSVPNMVPKSQNQVLMQNEVPTNAQNMPNLLSMLNTAPANVQNMQHLLSMSNMVPTNVQNMQNLLSMPNKIPNVLNQPLMLNTYPNLMNMNPANIAFFNQTTRTKENEMIRCIWVKGIPENYQDVDKLINIFGFFGNVQKVRLFDNKQVTALLELNDGEGAKQAVALMNNRKVQGSSLEVSLAKSNDKNIFEIDDDKTKDTSKIKETWRYMSAKNKFRQRGVLHMKDLSKKIVVWNIPAGKLDQLKEYVIENGFTVKSIVETKRLNAVCIGKEGTHKYTMALLELPSIDEAIGAIANLHNTWPKEFGAKRPDRDGYCCALDLRFAIYEDNHNF